MAAEVKLIYTFVLLLLHGKLRSCSCGLSISLQFPWFFHFYFYSLCRKIPLTLWTFPPNWTWDYFLRYLNCGLAIISENVPTSLLPASRWAHFISSLNWIKCLQGLFIPFEAHLSFDQRYYQFTVFPFAPPFIHNSIIKWSYGPGHADFWSKYLLPVREMLYSLHQ